MSKVFISPSLLSCDFGHILEEINKVESCGAEWIHYDVMDGKFVPNITFGAPVIKCVTGKHNLVNDVHLMIDRPYLYIKDFAEAGADYITIHYEACMDEREVFETLDKIHSFGKKAGISVKPKTPVDKIYKFLTSCDLVLIMTVEPGFGGQEFDLKASGKILRLREYLDNNDLPNVLISVDGGINDVTGKLCKDLGVDVLVAGSYIYKAKDVQERIIKLKE